MYPHVTQHALSHSCSDHNPIALICKGMKHGPSPLRCEYYWFSNPNFISFVREMWNSFDVSGSDGFVFSKKLQLLKQKLKPWSKEEYGEVNKRLEELEDIFADLDAMENANNGLFDSQWNDRVSARHECCNLIIIRAEKWRSRFRYTHVKDYDNNTKYFHRLANDRRIRSFIGSIKVNGVLTSDDSEIKNDIVDLFQNIFQSPQQSVISAEGMHFNQIFEEMCLWLERDIDEDEYFAAIKLLGKHKAPGPDGFPISFYTLCWDILKEDFLNILKEMQERNFFDWRLKNNFVALIPKKDCIEEIKNLRPISLVHGAYKVVSKILVERFKLTLPTIISSQQSAFVNKRQILDGVLITNELIDSRIISGKPGLLCKVDFEKAFDHVTWNFSDDMFKLMGFGEIWRNWIRCCVEYVRFSVLVNGSAAGYFKSNKGIRQGDPISPFVFLLVGEALTFMIKKTQEEGLLSGFQAKSDGTVISHLQFSDDTLIFLDADVEQVKNLILILLYFEMLTGLKIDFAKSQIFGVGFDGDLSVFSSILGCYRGVLPTIFIGLPLGDKCGVVAKWDMIIEKFISKLVGWKKTLLSRAVKWRALSRRKKFGGLGIKSLKQINHALLSKWIWRFATEDSALWRTIVAEKYGVNVAQWIPKTLECTYGRSVCRSIMKFKSSVLKFVKFKVNNGISVRFWDDNWIYDSPIKTCYPNLFALSRAKHISVSEMCVTDGPSYVWNLHTPTRLNDVARFEYNLLITDLASFKFTNDTTDELQWTLTKGKVFTVKSAYEKISMEDGLIQQSSIFTFIWNLKCPPKIGFFLLLIDHNNLPTRDLLNYRGIEVPVACGEIIPSLQAWNLTQHNAASSVVWNLDDGVDDVVVGGDGDADGGGDNIDPGDVGFLLMKTKEEEKKFVVDEGSEERDEIWKMLPLFKELVGYKCLN
ncbi:uncharacterized protein LOC113305622 [Papaver somniferum]|uniref:uncharacterized protein LOC113305622 n=1 Tax=Papaver somniferum TaxID=3469 RepID=UPI000E6FF40F|nr:uncharacterized protein LOC113305622 [Papaver somniferum]